VGNSTLIADRAKEDDTSAISHVESPGAQNGDPPTQLSLSCLFPTMVNRHQPAMVRERKEKPEGVGRQAGGVEGGAGRVEAAPPGQPGARRCWRLADRSRSEPGGGSCQGRGW
jgi:hypothetical protein